MKGRSLLLCLLTLALAACSDSDAQDASDGDADAVVAADAQVDAGPDGSDASGACSLATEGAACDDGDPCTLQDECSGGVCVGGVSLACDDPGPCSVGNCVAGTGCVFSNLADDEACSVPCFGQASCQAGTCEPVMSSAVVCPDSTNPCVTRLACAPETGACTQEVLAPVGAACDLDDDVCTLDRCDAAGACVDSGARETCAEENLNNPCWSYGCAGKSGCVQTNFVVGSSCDDLNPCTSNDTCGFNDLGQQSCVGTPLPIDDANPCTDDACVGGVVSHAPLDGVVCSLANELCGGAGLCEQGVCAATPVANCCGNGVCEVGEACSCVADCMGEACDDDACLDDETCQANGSCGGGTPAASCCGDGACTADELCGCTADCAGEACSDGDDATMGDVCQDDGSCLGTGCDIANEGAYAPTVDGELFGSHVFTSLVIPEGVTITGTGTAPLDITVCGDATIAGTLSVSGEKGKFQFGVNSANNNPGGAPGGIGGAACCGGGKGGNGGHSPSSSGTKGTGTQGGGRGTAQSNGIYVDGGNAGGGGHGTAGTYGFQAAFTGTAGSGGSAYGTTTLDPPTGGSGGGGGSGGLGGASTGYGGAGGGGGGGVVILESFGTVTIAATGAVLAEGGAGGHNQSTGAVGGGGAGAGGAIILRAPMIVNAGTVSAREGICSGSNGGDEFDGRGGSGRIRVETADGQLPAGTFVPTPGFVGTY